MITQSTTDSASPTSEIKTSVPIIEAPLEDDSATLPLAVLAKNHVSEGKWDVLQPQKVPPLEQKEIEKLDTWLYGLKYGDTIEGTYILPCKTFLDHPKWQPYLREDQKFHTFDLVDYLDTQGQKLGLIIDLNRSYDYYNIKEVKEKDSRFEET